MIRDDDSYFLLRAEDQMKLARRATCEKAARAHYYLAGFYWDRVFNKAASGGMGDGSSSRATA